MRTCPRCNKEFEAGLKQIKVYCSEKCRKHAEKRRWQLKSGKIQKPKAARPAQACVHCGKEFVPRDCRGRLPKYCSEVCRSIARDENRKAMSRAKTAAQVWHCQECGAELRGHKRRWCDECRRRRGAAPRHQLVCEHCGKRFNRPDKKYRFCSRDCTIEATRKRPHTMHCKGCGLPFEPKATDRMQYCSRECAYATKSRIKEERAWIEAMHRAACRARVQCCRRILHAIKESLPRIVRYCPECGKPKPYEAKFCRGCSTKRLKENQRKSRRKGRAKDTRKRLRKLYNRKRTLKLKVIKTAPYTATGIAERDGWRCGICNRPINPSLHYPHPMSLSMDHIVPLSKGGTDEPKNVQSAHWICNCRKSDQMNAQMRLF